MFLHCMIEEIKQTALDARIEKISQPSKEELLIALRYRGGACKLLLSARAASPRVQLTEQGYENPKVPPMFCMLLRKYLGSGRLANIRQEGLDRIIHFDFETQNELGDKVMITITAELMGRYSNLIVTDQDGKVIDSIRRITAEMSQVRQILPGMTYQMPPIQDKLSILQSSNQEILQRLELQKDKELSKALLNTLQGSSPLVCREITEYVTRGTDQQERLQFSLNQLRQRLKETAVPVMLLEKDGKPKEFSFLPISQYGNLLVSKVYPSFGALLDDFYYERDRIERVKQRSNDLFKMLLNTTDRIARKLEHQRAELKATADREQYKMAAELLSANRYLLQKGMNKVTVLNYYQKDTPEIEIALDPRYTPEQNIQKYYSEYKKAATAEKMLKQLIASGEQELQYIDSVFDALTRASKDAEISAIRQELVEQGYLKLHGPKVKKKENIGCERYISTDGFTILSGRNNLQNDKLTLKDATNYDMWLHTQKIPSAHVVIVANGKEIPNSTIEEAAIICAYNSKARNSKKVPVDYTIIKNVKKMPGAKPGMVIYNNFQTAIVDPDPEIVKRLAVK